MLVRLNSVGFRYGRRGPWILQEVSLSLPRGRVIEVTGLNGAGKSTLLRLIAGLLRPSRGSITGRSAKVGFAPEHFPAAQPFPVERYLRYLARMRRMSAAEAAAAIAGWAGRLGFEPLLGDCGWPARASTARPVCRDDPVHQLHVECDEKGVQAGVHSASRSTLGKQRRLWTPFVF